MPALWQTWRRKKSWRYPQTRDWWWTKAEWGALWTMPSASTRQVDHILTYLTSSSLAIGLTNFVRTKFDENRLWGNVGHLAATYGGSWTTRPWWANTSTNRACHWGPPKQRPLARTWSEEGFGWLGQWSPSPSCKQLAWPSTISSTAFATPNVWSWLK